MKNEVSMDKPTFLGFAVLELSKLLKYQTKYDKLQPCFKKVNLQLHCMDTDSFVLGMKTKEIFKDLKNLEDFFVLSNLNEIHEKFSE